MDENNLLAVLHKKRDLRLEEREIPQPGPGEVLIRVRHVGICGTDLHLYENGFCADKEVTTPIAIGHESSGVVSKLGEGVTSLKVGDKVAMDPVTGYMACPDCKKGNYNLCPSVRCCGVPPRWGSMAKYFVYKAADCYSGGTVVLAGLRQYSVTLPILNAAFREVDIRGVAVNAHCYPIAVDMVAYGQIDVKPLLSDKFKLEDVNKAFERALKKDCMKVMIECGD